MRTNIVGVIVGNRGTGKTDFTKKAIRHSKLPKTLIVDTFDNSAWHDMKTFDYLQGAKEKVRIIDKEDLTRWQKGVYRIIETDEDQLFEIVDQKVRNTLVIFEDATRYIENTLHKKIKNFVYNTKQTNVDALFVFHSLTDVPPKLIRVANTLTLFKTLDTKRRVEQKYDNPSVSALYDRVKASTDKYFNETIYLH